MWPKHGECTVNCSNNCGKAITKKEIEGHQQECPKVPIVCDYCKIEFERGDNRQHIAECKILCPKGCEKIVFRNQVESHRNECSMEFIPCTNECEEMVQRNSMQLHLNECPLSIICCEFCNLSFERKETKKHNEDCSPPCKNGCGALILRGLEKDHHSMDCPVVNVSCDGMGCPWKGQRSEKEQHQLGCIPAMVVNTWIGMKNDSTNNKTQFNVLGQRVVRMEEKQEEQILISSAQFERMQKLMCELLKHHEQMLSPINKIIGELHKKIDDVSKEVELLSPRKRKLAKQPEQEFIEQDDNGDNNNKEEEEEYEPSDSDTDDDSFDDELLMQLPQTEYPASTIIFNGQKVSSHAPKENHRYHWKAGKVREKRDKESHPRLNPRSTFQVFGKCKRWGMREIELNCQQQQQLLSIWWDKEDKEVRKVWEGKAKEIGNKEIAEGKFARRKKRGKKKHKIAISTESSTSEEEELESQTEIQAEGEKLETETIVQAEEEQIESQTEIQTEDEEPERVRVFASSQVEKELDDMLDDINASVVPAPNRANKPPREILELMQIAKNTDGGLEFQCKIRNGDYTVVQEWLTHNQCLACTGFARLLAISQKNGYVV